MKTTATTGRKHARERCGKCGQPRRFIRKGESCRICTMQPATTAATTSSRPKLDAIEAALRALTAERAA